MTSNKRAKALARAKADRQAERRANRAKRQRIINRIVAVVAVVVIAGGGVTWWALSKSGGSTDGGNSTPTPQPTQTTDGPSPSPTTQPDPACTKAPAMRTNDMSFDKPGDAGITPKTTYSMVLTTNCGDVTIETYADKAPQTVNAVLGATRLLRLDQMPSPHHIRHLCSAMWRSQGHRWWKPGIPDPR